MPILHHDFGNVVVVFDQAFSLCASFGLFFRNEKFNGTFVFLISMVKGSSIFVKIVNKFSVLLSYDFLFSMLIVRLNFCFVSCFFMYGRSIWPPLQTGNGRRTKLQNKRTSRQLEHNSCFSEGRFPTSRRIGFSKHVFQRRTCFSTLRDLWCQIFYGGKKYLMLGWLLTNQRI